MPPQQQQPNVSVENNFTGGLKTEYTGLNFPENAATDTDNCVYSLVGDVSRRLGIDLELNFNPKPLSRGDSAVCSYKWNNAGGDGLTQILVLQVDNILYFFRTSSATTSSPISAQECGSFIDLNLQAPIGGTIPPGPIECQFADGNGYLFVFHPNCNPFYCTYTDNPLVFDCIITTQAIPVQIRDLSGIVETGVGTSSRPTVEAQPHIYNLFNQGWNSDLIGAFFTSGLGTVPSNADVWWRFKDDTGTFNPLVTDPSIQLRTAAPKGSIIMNAFNIDRSGASGQSGIPVVSNLLCPRTGTWFQGRVWYTGLDASTTSGSPDVPWYTWTENIYFSQIAQTADQFGKCYQQNDPTDEDLFDVLSSDGGVIQIQGSGAIYKLFPIQNGLLVFASNGVWYITGSSGIGFAANDYAVVKISSVKSISATSFVEVNGLPIFWNEEGIYSVTRAEQGKGLLSNPLFVSPLDVNPITVGTILSFYTDIPLESRKYARGDYDPIEYTVKWVYKSTQETDIHSRYEYDRVLNYNVYNKAFYPYTIGASTTKIIGLNYISYPGSSTAPDPAFKYITWIPEMAQALGVFSEERDDTTYTDFRSIDGIGVNYVSYFVTGYRIKGQAQKLFQSPYIYMFSDSPNTSYKIQSIWNYANSGNSGKFSQVQVINNSATNFDKMYRRHRLRGHGIAMQIKVASVDGQPFNIMGWSFWDTVNQSI